MNNTWKIYMLTLISFVVGTSQFVIVGILDKVAASVGVSVSTAGQLISAFALANAIGTPIVMMVTAKLNRRIQLMLALSILLLGIVSTVAFSGFGLLMASRVILGIATGVFIVSAYATAAELAPTGHQGRAISYVTMGFSAALVFGVPLGRVITGVYDWKMIFVGLGILSLLAIFAVARAIPALKGEASISIGKQLALLKMPRISLSLGVTFILFTGYSGVNTYITPFLTSAISVSDRAISAILFALGIASLIGSKVGGFLSDRIGTVRTLLGSLAVITVALALVAVVSASAISSVALLMLWMIAVWTFGPSQNFNLVSLAPDASGIMLSLNSSFLQLGFAAGAGIGGIAVSNGSMLTLSWIGAIAAALALVVLVVSLRAPLSFMENDTMNAQEEPSEG